MSSGRRRWRPAPEGGGAEPRYRSGAPGKASRSQRRFGWTWTEPNASVQRKEDPSARVAGESQGQTSPPSADAPATDAIAASVSGPGSQLPHGDRIQAAFGHHDVSGIRAHVGGEAGRVATSIGAQAFATGHGVGFARPPDLHTAAHEAAHVVQQRAGAVARKPLRDHNESGAVYERHADLVADAVVAGRSAAGLLDAMPRGGSSTRGALQRKPDKAVSRDPDEAARPYTAADAVQQVKLALRAATGAARSALAAARKARNQHEASAELERGASLIGRHVSYAKLSMGTEGASEIIKAEALLLADAIDIFMKEAAALTSASMETLRDLTPTVEEWAETPGKVTSATRKGFDSKDAGQGVGLSLRATREIAELAIKDIERYADGDSRPLAIGLATANANRIVAQLDNVKLLFSTQITDPETRKDYANDTETASRALGDLIAWGIYMRADSQQLKLVEALMNEVRRAVGLPEEGWLGKRPRDEPLPKMQRGIPITARDFGLASQMVVQEYTALGKARMEGVDELETKIPKVDREDLGWFQEVVVFVAQTALQAATGFLGGAIAHKLAAAGATAASQRCRERCPADRSRRTCQKRVRHRGRRCEGLLPGAV
jgi:Domain of unknown function (DUF4157)